MELAVTLNQFYVSVNEDIPPLDATTLPAFLRARLVFQLSNLMEFAGSSWQFSLSKPRDLTMCHVVFWKNSPMSPLKTSVCRSLGAPTVAWHLSISRILIETSLIFKVPFSHLWEHRFQRQKGTFFALLIGTFLNRKKGTFFVLLMRLLVTAKRYLFCSFDRNVSKPQKRYLFRAFDEIACNRKKVPFLLFW